jgi:hypothetical protein
MVPAMAKPDPGAEPLKIMPRPPYPWPLNPLRLLLHLLEKSGAALALKRRNALQFAAI